MSYYNNMNKQVSTNYHLSMGLVFRNNNLLMEADRKAQQGDYDGWNLCLDRIHCNMSYRENMEIIKDEDGNIIDMNITEEANKIYIFFEKKIVQAKLEYYKALNNPKIPRTQKYVLKSRWYHAIRKKDLWLRKHMQSLGLYLKEVEKIPGSVLFA